MNKNKGFTLVELIGIIIILSIITIVGVPSMLNTLQRNKDKEYETYKETLYLAAEIYISENIETISDFSDPGDKVEIELSTLVTEGLIKNNLEDHRDDINVTHVKVTISSDGTYSYDVIEESV